MIERVTNLNPVEMEGLVAASQQEGFRFVARLCSDWVSGTNRFDRPGEALYGLYADDILAGVGGINRLNESTGRLRRFYILPSHRRRGLGRILLNHLLSHAVGHFRLVVLRTDTLTADRFYRACGFTPTQDFANATHRIELPDAEPGGSIEASQARRKRCDDNAIYS